jgi:hypothetical protein
MLAGVRVVAWVTLALCLLRGLPVIVDSLRRYVGVLRVADA